MKAIFIEAQSPLRANYNIILALFIRELKTRFGKQRLGILWSFIEPAAHILTFTAIWQIRGSTDIYGISILLFILSGIQPYNFFTSMISRSMTSCQGNKGLFSFRQVKPIHALIARWILEFGIFIFVYGVFILIGLWFGIGVAPYDHSLILIAYFFLAIFGAGLGLMASALVILFPETEKIIPLVMRPLYFLSGVFYSSKSLPSAAMEIIGWNPVFCAIDIARYGYFGIPSSEHISLLYLGFSASSTLLVGLYLYKRHWTKMVGT